MLLYTAWWFCGVGPWNASTRSELGQRQAAGRQALLNRIERVVLMSCVYAKINEICFLMNAPDRFELVVLPDGVPKYALVETLM